MITQNEINTMLNRTVKPEDLTRTDSTAFVVHPKKRYLNQKRVVFKLDTTFELSDETLKKIVDKIEMYVNMKRRSPENIKAAVTLYHSRYLVLKYEKKISIPIELLNFEIDEGEFRLNIIKFNEIFK